MSRAEELLKALVTKLDEITAHDSYRGVFTLAHVHGATYSGPTFEAEINDARAYLTRERGPMAEGKVSFYRYDSPERGWYFVSGYASDPADPGDFRVLVEVPAHIANPPTLTGEVVDG